MMRKKFAVVFLVFLIFTFLSPSWVFSVDFNRAYQDYIYQYNLYREAYQEYTVAKNKYLTYKTLVTQKEALEKTKNFLQLRDQVLINYLTMLRGKILETPGVSPDQASATIRIIDIQVPWLLEHKNALLAASSLKDLVRVSSQTEDRFGRIIQVEAAKAVGIVLIGKEENLSQKMESIINTLESKLWEIKKSQDTSLEERWLLEAKNKQILAEEKRSLAQNGFVTLSPKDLSSEFNKSQFTLVESHQYLKEGQLFLKEIIRRIKGE